MSRLHPFEARYILACVGIDWRQPHDFHALDSATVQALIDQADLRGYRVPKNANGSRARYFHAYLIRTAQRHDKVPYGLCSVCGHYGNDCTGSKPHEG